MDKNNAISKGITIVVTLIVVALAVYLGIKLLPQTGDEMVGHTQDDLIVQSFVEMNETNINTLTGGKVAKICVQEGDHVAAGDVIAVMDSETLLAKKQQAQATIKAAQGQAEAAQ